MLRVFSQLIYLLRVIFLPVVVRNMLLAPSLLTKMDVGYDGVRLWRTSTFQELPTPPRKPDIHGQTTQVRWFQQRNAGELALCYGTAKGVIVFWQQNAQGRFETMWSHRIGDGQEVLAIAVDNTDSNYVRLAFGTLCRRVQVWKYDTNGKMTVQISVCMDSTVPRGLVFVSAKFKSKNIMVFGFDDGLV
jgi:hypothetical protein